jgi:hypothetical protein
MAKTCSEEEGGLDNKMHLRQKYICANDILMQQETFFFCIVGGWNQGPLDTVAT